MQLNISKYLSRLIQRYLRSIFNEKKVTKELQAELISYYYKKLKKAFKIGYQNKPQFDDQHLVDSLLESLVEFSAFKEASFRHSLLELLTTSSNLPTWSEFKVKAMEVSKLYNVNWLKTEYHHTIASSNMASKWSDFLETKDIYPNLEYVTAGDGRVRDKHKKWHGFIAPIEHPIWKKILPPNDWGCRCDVIPTDVEPSEGFENVDIKVKKEFKNNPALSGKIFNSTSYADSLPENLKSSVKQNIEDFKR